MSNTFHQPLSDEETLAQIAKTISKSRFVFPALVLKLRYRLWLALLRDASILSSLIQHYDKIPSRTFSKFLIGLFVKYNFLRTLLYKVERILRKRIY